MGPMCHSRFLFTTADGEAMEFCVRSREETDRLAALIEHGGGIVTKTCGPHVIRLINPDCKALNVRDEEKVLYVQYILDCVEQNRLLDMASYSLRIESKSVSDISSEDNSDLSPDIEIVDSNDFDIPQANVSTHDVARGNVSQAKQHDTAQAKVKQLDIAPSNVTEHKINYRTGIRASIRTRKIIDYILEHADNLWGIYQYDLFDELAENKVIIMSEKRNFRRQISRICDGIKVYKLTVKEEKLVLDILSKMKKKKKKFNKEENIKMIDYVIKNDLYARVWEKAMYREMEDKKVLERDVTSMYKQFTQVVLPNLRRYDLSDYCRTQLSLSLENSKLDVQKGISSKIEREHSDDKSESGESSLSEFSDSRSGSTKNQKSAKLNNSRKPETAMQIAEKRKYSNEDVNNDIGDSSSDDFSCTHKAKKRCRLLSTEEQSDSLYMNKRSCSSTAKDRDNVSNTTKSPKQNCETSRSVNGVSNKVSNVVDGITDKVSSERRNHSNKISEYFTIKNSQNAAKPETKNKASPQVEKKVQQTLKFFDAEKCSLSLTDTLDDLISDDKEPSDPNFDINSSAAGEISTIKKFLTDQLSGSSNCLELEDNTVPVVDGKKERLSLPSPQPDNCENVSQDNKLSPSLNEVRSQNEMAGQEVTDAQSFNQVVAEVCNEKKNEVEIADSLMDRFVDQVDESSQEYVSPTLELFGTETLSLNISDEVGEDRPMLPEGTFCAKENHFTKCLSILKNIEAEVVDMAPNRIKNNLQGNINKLYFKLYQQRFKESIGGIMKKDKLSVADKAILLKSIAYTSVS